MKKKLRFCCLLLAAFVVCGALAHCDDDHGTPPPLKGGQEEGGGNEGGGEEGGDEGNEGGETGKDGYPVGLVVEAFEDALPNGSKCLGFYAVADFKANPRLRFRPQFSAAKKPTQYFADFRASGKGTPLVAVNGGFFGGKTSVSLLVEEGEVRSLAVQEDWIWSTEPYTHFFPVRAAFGQMADGSFDAAWVYCVADDGNRPYAFPSALGNDEKNKVFMPVAPTSHTAGGRLWKALNAIGGGPMLVYEGRNVAEENYWKEIFDSGGLAGLSRQPRTALGATADGKLILVVCDGRKKRGSAGFTLPELADKLIALGCVQAINLDGGGSSTFIGREGAVLNMPSDTPGTEPDGATVKERSIPTAVIVSEE